MGFNKKTIIILVAIMGLGLQWLQSQSKNSQLRFDRSERVFALDEFVPFARKAGEIIVENKSFQTARKAVQNLRGRVAHQFERATLVVKNAIKSEVEPDSVTTTATPVDAELAKALEGKSEEEVAAILAEKAKEKENEEKNVIGYDEEGNPIYATEETDSPEGDEDAVAADETAEEAKEELKAENKDKDNSDSSPAPAAGTEIVYTGGAAPQEADADKEEEQHACNDSLLRQPDYTNMAKCIDQYQIGQVSAEAFYAIVTEMLADSRAPIRKLAADAVKSTPSFKSFLLLVDLSNREAFGSEISDLVTAAINEYATLRQLSVIAQVLTSNDETVSLLARITATKVLDQAANKYMGRNTASNSGTDGELIPEGENTSQEGEVKTLSETQQRFQLFVAVLENFIASQPESNEAIGYANQALNNIKSLLGV